MRGDIYLIHNHLGQEILGKAVRMTNNYIYVRVRKQLLKYKHHQAFLIDDVETIREYEQDFK